MAVSRAGNAGRRILGLDVGDARIGLAISDEDGLLATPVTAISRVAPDMDIRSVLDAAAEAGAGCIVVGLPLSLDGSHGPRARKTAGFRRSLQAATDLPVEAWDERFSTVEAERKLREIGVQPSRDRARLDSAAAAIILQAYLDAHRDAHPDLGTGSQSFTGERN